MEKSTKFKFLLIAAMLAVSPSVFAQVKIGDNPTTIGSNSNLEVEATNASKLVVQKDNGNVGIGANAPGNKLEINQGSAGNSGLRFTQMNNGTAATTTNVSPLGVNVNGDVIVLPNSAIVYRGTVDVGDITTSTAGTNVAYTGYFTSATKSGGDSGDGALAAIIVTFPSVGTSDYSVTASYEAVQVAGGGYNSSTVNSPVITNKTATGFRVYMRENRAVGQDLRLNVIMAK